MGNCANSTTTKKNPSKSNAESQDDYSEQTIAFNEYPFCIEGDKLKQKLHRSVGALTFLDKKEKLIHAGSAALISKDSILTCAHNIFDKDNDSENTNFKFYIGANGVAEEYYQVESFRFPQEFKTCKKSNKMKSDYAIMKLKRPILFDEYLSLSQVCQECTLRDNQNIKVMIYGFPVFKQNFQALDEEGNKIRLYQYGLTRKNRILSIDFQGFNMRYSISTISGQSGCPVVINNSIVAVHAGGDKGKCNIGRIIDASLISSLSEWVKDLKTTPFNVQKKKCEHTQNTENKENNIDLKNLKNSFKSSLQKKMELTRKDQSFSADEKTFINSGLLCISHIKELAEYFVSTKFAEENNMLKIKRGIQPKLSTAFAKVLQQLWLESRTLTSLNSLKTILKFQTKNQQVTFIDLSDFVSYFLYALHQDLLNIPKVGQNFKAIVYDGRPDKIIAQQLWQMFLNNNKSIITNLFFGQYKSIIYCMECQHQSIQFDPFLMLSLPLINNNKINMEIIFIKDHCEEIAVNVSYDIKDKPTFKFAFEEIAKKLNLPIQTKLVAYAASYSSCQYLDDSSSLQSAIKEHYYRTFYARQLLKGQDPEKDTKVFLINKIKQSIYSYYLRKSISSARLYFFSKDLTYKQVHYKIYSYFKRFYEVSNYEIDVIKAEPKETPFRILCIAQTRYNNCEHCNIRDCDGCDLKFTDDKFLDNVKVKIVEMEIEWIKNSKEIQEKMEDLRVNSDGPKSSSKSAGIKIGDCFNLFQEPEILGEDNAWYCPKCKKFVLAKKQMMIYKAPKILIVALKRFKRKEYFSEKHTVFVNYPVNGLDLSNYVINPDLPHQQQGKGGKLIYDLIGVSNHMGSTGGGHYTAYCKDIADNQWYEFDDSHVSRVKDSQEVVSASGYVLFYRRQD